MDLLNNQMAMTSVMLLGAVPNNMKILISLLTLILYAYKEWNNYKEKILLFFRQKNYYFVEFSEKKMVSESMDRLEAINYCCNNIFYDVFNMSHIGKKLIFSKKRVIYNNSKSFEYYGDLHSNETRTIILNKYLNRIDKNFDMEPYKKILDVEIFMRWKKCNTDSNSSNREDNNPYERLENAEFIPIIFSKKKKYVFVFIDFCRNYLHFLENEKDDSLKGKPKLYEICVTGEDRHRDVCRNMIVDEIINKNYDNIFLSKINEEIVFNAIKNFTEKKEKYKELGMPHKLGLMLSGPPGEGKSSLIYAIANEKNMNIDMIKLKNMTNKEFIRYCANCKNRIIVFEEIDTFEIAISREIKKENAMTGELNNLKEEIKQILTTNNGSNNGPKNININKDELTLDTLLVTLDGGRGLDGCIIIMTTNHLEVVDPAIYRKGRVDHIIEFKKCDKHQINKIFNKFYGRDFPENIKFIDNIISVSEIINTIVFPNIDNMEKAIKQIENYFQ